MEQDQRAYSAFVVKALDSKRRTFSGWATTPAVDRVLDTINPLGAKFTNPLVLLHQHDNTRPIGQVRFKKPTSKGIEFDAEIPVIEEPGMLKDRVDMAWGEIAYGLVRAVSIGFRAKKYSYKEDGGIDFQEVEIFELSTVSVPALPEAVITQVKSMDGAPLSAATIRQIKSHDYPMRAASGHTHSGAVQLVKSPGASGTLTAAQRGAVIIIPRNRK
jgi:HK97 family phage prohead protease